MSFFKRFSLFLLPSVFQAIISLVMLPITTYVLGPAEFGVFALISSFTAFGTTFAAMGGGYMIAAHYPMIEKDDKRAMVTTMVVTSLMFVIFYAVVFFALWPLITAYWQGLNLIPRGAVAIALLSMILGVPWILSIDIITIEGKAGLFAATLIVQSLASAVAVSVALYVARLGLTALFISSLTGMAVTFVGALIALRRHLHYLLDKKWFAIFFKLGIKTLPANLLESFHVIIERSVLSLYVGLAQLGIYTHSQQYKTMAMMALKAGSRTVWPVTLAEARDEQSMFPMTKYAWNMAYLGLTALGILFAAFGKEIIGVLTHGKFVDAAFFVVLWMVFLLVQNAGKPYTGILWAGNKGPLYARIQFGALIISIALLFVMVPWLGALGAIVALFAQMILFRVWLQFHIKKYRMVPFQDRWVLLGGTLILSTYWISWYFHFGLIENVFLLCGMYGVVIGLGWNILKQFVAKLL